MPAIWAVKVGTLTLTYPVSVCSYDRGERRASDPLNKRPKFFDLFTHLKGVGDDGNDRQCTTTKGREVTILQTSFKHGL